MKEGGTGLHKIMREINLVYKGLKDDPLSGPKMDFAIQCIVSSPDTKFFAHALRPCRKIRSGHVHW